MSDDWLLFPALNYCNQSQQTRTERWANQDSKQLHTAGPSAGKCGDQLSQRKRSLKMPSDSENLRSDKVIKLEWDTCMQRDYVTPQPTQWVHHRSLQSYAQFPAVMTPSLSFETRGKNRLKIKPISVLLFSGECGSNLRVSVNTQIKVTEM